MISIDNNIIPIFSVVICSYNRGRLLRRAVGSVLAQTEKDYEIIIVDDGSTDDTHKIAREYCKSHRNIRYTFHRNRGLSNARNVGILMASGVYVTFLDSDDEYAPEHLDIRKRALLQNPELDLLHGGVKIIGSEYVPDKFNPEKMIHLHDCVIGGTFFLKKESALRVDGFSYTLYGDDNMFFNKAKKLGFKIGKIDAPTYIYHRDQEDSLCNVVEKHGIEKIYEKHGKK